MSKFIIISAPSGSGKSTLASHLLTNISSLSFSVSSTTRTMRKNEVHGVNYYFISNDEFKKNIDNQNFVEWEQVYNNDYKGTLKSEIDRLVSSGKKRKKGKEKKRKIGKEEKWKRGEEEKGKR